MKKLPLLLLLCIVLSTNAQKIIKTEQVSDHSIHIIGDRFEGVIFSKEYSPIFHLFPNNIKRCSIDTEDILSAERILAEDLRNKQSHKINDLFIRENLKKYLRQYAGYYDSKGRKIVIINFFWQKEILSEEKEHKALPHFFPEPQWRRSWLMVNDGGHYYWQIKVNLAISELFEFGENGLA